MKYKILMAVLFTVGLFLMLLPFVWLGTK